VREVEGEEAVLDGEARVDEAVRDERDEGVGAGCGLTKK